MKWVKCIYNGQGNIPFYYDNITVGEIYRVVGHTYELTYLSVIDDGGNAKQVARIINDIIWFEDATAEVLANERDKKINSILDEMG